MGISVGKSMSVPVGVAEGLSVGVAIGEEVTSVVLTPGRSGRILVKISPNPELVKDAVGSGVISGVGDLVVPVPSDEIAEPVELSLGVGVADGVAGVVGSKMLVMGSRIGSRMPSAELVGEADAVDPPVPENETPSSEELDVGVGVDDGVSSELVEIIPLGPNSIPLEDEEVFLSDVVDSSSDVGMVEELVG